MPVWPQLGDPDSQRGAQIFAGVGPRDHEALGRGAEKEIVIGWPDDSCIAQQIEKIHYTAAGRSIGDLDRVGHPPDELANGAFFQLLRRHLTQLEPERIGDTGRGHRIRFAAAWRARDRPTVCFAGVVAKHDVESQHVRGGVEEMRIRPEMFRDPVLQFGALRRAYAHQITIRCQRSTGRNDDFRVGILRHGDL